MEQLIHYNEFSRYTPIKDISISPIKVVIFIKWYNIIIVSEVNEIRTTRKPISFSINFQRRSCMVIKNNHLLQVMCYAIFYYHSFI